MASEVGRLLQDQNQNFHSDAGASAVAKGDAFKAQRKSGPGRRKAHGDLLNSRDPSMTEASHKQPSMILVGKGDTFKAKKREGLDRMKALGDLSNSEKLCMAEASQNQLSVTFVGKGDVCKPQWTPVLGRSEVHASNSGKPSMTEASQKQPSVIDNYKCKFVMTKEERARQHFMHNHGKCIRLYDFEPKCIPDRLRFHPSPKCRTSWEHSKMLCFHTSSSLPDPCFSSSLNFDYNMMVREEPESPTH